MAFCRESISELTEIEITLPSGEGKVVEIEPGQAYGRGKYQSTTLCISVMEELFRDKEIKTFLDVGSGTGVLSICASLLGAESVTALDVDPLAIEETKINAERNGVRNKLEIIYDSIGGAGGKYDLVVANLGNTQVLNLSEGLKSKVDHNGFLLLSGIWQNHQKKVVSKQFAELNLVQEFKDGGWIALLFRLRQ